MNGNHLDIFWKICLDTIETYLSYGYDVVFNYIVNPENLVEIENRFGDYFKKFVVLITDEEILLKRDALRDENCQMKERCIVLLNNFKNNKYDKDYCLNTSNLTINETIIEIENNEKYQF